ncbi:MAG: hypothetical protein NVS9B15_09410 [Acidobacteriaceae bacterium]
MFTRSGVLSHDNGHAFAKDLPQGYFGIGTVIFAGAAVSTTTPIKITFDDDVNTDRYIFTLSVVP